MKDENKTKAELIKELNTLRKERGENALTDITECKKAEDALRESEEKYNRLFSKMMDGFALHEIICDRNGKPIDYVTLEVNKSYEKIMGVKKKAVVGIKASQLIPAKELNEWLELFGSTALMGKSRRYIKYSSVNDKYFEGIVYCPQKSQFAVTFVDITERKQVEEELKDSEERLKILFDYVPDAYYISDLKGNIVDGNKAAEKIIGYKKEELIGKSFLKLKLISISDIPKAAKLLAKSVMGLPTGPDEFVLNRKDNSKVTVENSTYPVKIKGETLVLGIARDITERKQAEEELRQSEEKYRGIFDESIAAIYLFDAQKNFIDSNQAGLDLLGYIRKELLKMSIPDVDADTEAVLPAHKKLLAGDRIVNYEHQLKRKDGSIITVLNNSRPLIDIDGNVVGMQSTLIDITERKQAEENMKKAKDELQMIMDSVPALIIYKDIEGKIIRANKTLADRLEIPVKDIVGKAIEELFPKEQAENMRKDDKEVIISGKPKRDIIQPYDTPDGTRWTITDKMPYKDKKGKIIGVIAFAKDITVQRKSKQKLQQTFQRLKKAMDATIDTMSKIIEAKDPYTSGHQHRVCQLAVPLAQELGLSEDKVEGIRIASLIHDIGKIGLPTEILSKPTTLIDIEFSLIKGHSQIGYDILKPIDFPHPIAQIVLQHHERLNGSGYPNKLKGDEILLEAKIIGIADVVEAMSSHRPYRPALGIDAAVEEISKNKGILYDPKVVDVCIRLVREKGFKFYQT